MKNGLEIFGEVRGFETKLEFEEKNGLLIPHDTGIVVAGSEYEKRNTLSSLLSYYLPCELGANRTDQAMDSLFASSGTVASVGAANNGKDGIVAIDEDLLISHIFTTTLNAGGTNAENYIEFYGTIDGSVTLTPYLGIGFNYVNATTSFTKSYATTTINKTIAANRRYHHYWKITVSV